MPMFENHFEIMNYDFLNRMSIVEAIVAIIFGMVLPTWDVYSDIALSHSFISRKVCTWEDYVREYKDGVEPPVNQTIGKFIDLLNV